MCNLLIVLLQFFFDLLLYNSLQTFFFCSSGWFAGESRAEVWMSFLSFEAERVRPPWTHPEDASDGDGSDIDESDNDGSDIDGSDNVGSDKVGSDIIRADNDGSDNVGSGKRRLRRSWRLIDSKTILIKKKTEKFKLF